jgi:hypothetical protein
VRSRCQSIAVCREGHAGNPVCMALERLQQSVHVLAPKLAITRRIRIRHLY